MTVASAGGGSGGMVDPTTTLGDLIVRGSAAPVRLGVGANGQILTADSAAPLGLKWSAPGAASQTPWTSDIDAATHALNNVLRIGVGTPSPASILHVASASSAVNTEVRIESDVSFLSLRGLQAGARRPGGLERRHGHARLECL